jgi:hypothetical protein
MTPRSELGKIAVGSKHGAETESIKYLHAKVLNCSFGIITYSISETQIMK